LPANSRLVAHAVEDAVAFELGDALGVQLARGECACPCTDDHRARVVNLPRVGGDCPAVVSARERLGALLKAHRRLETHRLANHRLREVFRQHFREAWHVVHILFRVQRSELPTEFGQAVDDFCAHPAQPRIKRAEQAHRTAADNRDVVQVGVHTPQFYPNSGQIRT
jgi:hypothetical protein